VADQLTRPTPVPRLLATLDRDRLAIEAEALAAARTAVEAELALIFDPMSPFSAGAAAAYNWVLAILAADSPTVET
jgi:hypothetical protein